MADQRPGATHQGGYPRRHWKEEDQDYPQTFEADTDALDNFAGNAQIACILDTYHAKNSFLQYGPSSHKYHIQSPDPGMKS